METVNAAIEPEWKRILSSQFVQPYFNQLKDFLIEEKKKYIVYPKGKDIFNAFAHCPFNKVKVVIIGQDPYHGAGQAHGLSFSVPEGVKPPPSLVNIFKEIKTDLDLPIPAGGNLTKWADQGVLLLNASLTVRANEPGSHQNRGWEIFTNEAIKQLSEKKKGVVFLLWGKFAQAKEQFIDGSQHHILKAAHPSPFSAYQGFFGCRHFSKTNEILKSHGHNPIDWSLS